MTADELAERLQEIDDRLDLIRQHAFICSDELQKIITDILSGQGIEVLKHLPGAPLQLVRLAHLRRRV
jgi:hypothetical protein